MTIDDFLSRIALPDQFIARYWSRVHKTDGCWLWTGTTVRSGYGHIAAYIGGKQYAFRAHRIAALIAGHDIPTGMLVCHSCDNPSCVNPAHLFVGTNRDNQRDMFAKGRCSARPPIHWGENNTNTKLTEQGVRQIRDGHAQGMSMRRIAMLHGVDTSTVSAVVNRRTWKHVP